MNADELDALLDGLPEEVTSVSKQSSVASRQGPPQPPPPRFPRFAKFGIHASPTTGEESETASVAVSNALRKRPPRVSAGEWVFALQKAQNFEHANARRGADRFLTLPTGPRLRYHVWGDKKDDQGDLIDILLLHDLGEAGGGFADLGVALARRGYRVFAPGRFGPFPNPGTLVAHTRLTLFLYNRRFPRPRRQRPRPAVQHLHVSRGPKKLRSGAGFVPKTVHSVRVRFRGFNRLSVHGRVWATSGRLDRLRCGSVLFVKRPIQLSPHASRAVRRRAVVH